MDKSSYGNMDEIITKHIDLNVRVDFLNKELVGWVILRMERLKSIDRIDLDMSGLMISGVFRVLDSDEQQLQYVIDKVHSKLGERLRVFLSEEIETEIVLKIYYKTLNNEDQRSINWLNKDQTADKTMEYLFTQCESINCRSLFPLQDSPSVRITYSATILVPKRFKVQMSAIIQSVQPFDDDSLSYKFDQVLSIPSYLIALAVGDLHYASLGDRVGVIAEQSQLPKIVKCLENLSQYLDVAEKTFGEYKWGNYTILVLPPSFPFGGMENPLMTFASPTIITEDQQQVYVAIHEILHSWFGNTITMANWTDFWLNEGFTVFGERTVSEIIFGEDFRKIQSQIGYSDMLQDMTVFGFNHSYSSLKPDINYDNPDDMFSTVPYEKGYFFLLYLQSLIGKPMMLNFLNKYIQQFEFNSIKVEQFVNSFKMYCNNNKLDISSVDWQRWLNEAGVPPVMPDLSTKVYEDAIYLAELYLNQSSQIDFSQFSQFFSSVKVLFLNHLLLNKERVNLFTLKRLDRDLNLTLMDNPEVKQRWYVLCIQNYHLQVLNPIAHFLSQQGRLKYLQPIYRAFMQADQKMQQFAKDTYQQNLNFYHPLAIKSIYNILYPAQKPSYHFIKSQINKLSIV